MRGFTVWLAGPAAGLPEELAAGLSDYGFRTELLSCAEVAALTHNDQAAEHVTEYLARRLTAHGLVVVIEAASWPASNWPELRVSVGEPHPRAELVVDPGLCGLPAAAGQVIHELHERDLTDSGEDKNVILDRLKSIGYLG